MTNEIVHTAKWLYFTLAHEGEKTKRWNVCAQDGEILLGTINWLGRWRQYAFFPLPETVFERQCLRDIAEFCEQQTAAWRAAKAPVIADEDGGK